MGECQLVAASATPTTTDAAKAAPTPATTTPTRDSLRRDASHGEHEAQDHDPAESKSMIVPRSSAPRLAAKSTFVEHTFAVRVSFFSAWIPRRLELGRPPGTS
jgi:hypothetical protein